MATTKKAAEAATGEAQSLTFNERVIALQNELKAPKSKYNSFGKYAYRSCEDILEAVKPLLARHGLRLNISDQVIYFGNGENGRFYVKATTTLTDGESWLTSEGWAREEETKKGMDGSQITGTASSYARKYALNGLLLIDDTKDADTDEYTKQTGGRFGKTSALDREAYEREIDEQPTYTALQAWWRKNASSIPEDIYSALLQRCQTRAEKFNAKTQEG